MAEEDKREPKGLSGFLDGVTQFLEKLEDVAERGAEIKRSGTFPAPEGGGPGGEQRKGAFGFSVKMGLGGSERGRQDFDVQPVPSPRRARSERPQAEDVREPLVDVHEEDDRLVIVAEMPGIEQEDVHVDLSGRTLSLSAERGDRKYRKKLEVPADTPREALQVSFRNGIVEIVVARHHA